MPSQNVRLLSQSLVVSAVKIIELYNQRQINLFQTYPDLELTSPLPEYNIKNLNICCAVCKNRKATGRHYGVFSCFGCKSFWQRSIFMMRRYKCKFFGDCPVFFIRHTNRNICRACRFRKCFNVGMNPNAVQAERDRQTVTPESNDNDNDFDHFKKQTPSAVTKMLSSSVIQTATSEESPILTSLLKSHSTDDLVLLPPPSVADTIPDPITLVGMDEINSVTPHTPTMMLPTNGNYTWHSVINQLLTNHVTLCNRIVPITSTMSTLSPQQSRGYHASSTLGMSYCQDEQMLYNFKVKSISFRNAFCFSRLIGKRTKLMPTGSRIANFKDVIDDWQRCFVLYSDWLQGLPEFQHFALPDQLILAKHRFQAFHYWICSLWSISANLPGLCYSNGTYTPVVSSNATTDAPSQTPTSSVSSTLSCYSNVLNILFQLFVEPMLRYKLSEVEQCVTFVLALFDKDNATAAMMTLEGPQRVKATRDFYCQAFYKWSLADAVQKKSKNPHFDATTRLKLIKRLAGTLRAISLLSTNHGILNDYLLIID